jgi:hypothetical protein
MNGAESSLLDPVLRGVEPLLQKESRSAGFGAKVAPSLNGADLSFVNSVTGSACRAKCSNILHDTCIELNSGLVGINFQVSSCFFMLESGAKVIKLFPSSMTLPANELECLFLSPFSSLY